MDYSSLFNALRSSNVNDWRDQFRQYGFDPYGDNEVSTTFNKLLMPNYLGAVNDTQFALGLQPQYQSALANFMQQFSPQGIDSQAHTAMNQSNEQYAQAARQAAMQAKASGLGDGFQAGMLGGSANAQAMNAGNIWNQYHSPQYQQQAMQNIFGAYNQANQSPFMSQLYGMNSPLEQANARNQSQRSTGFLGQIAPYVGMATGAGSFNGLGNLFGGGAFKTATKAGQSIGGINLPSWG